MAPRSIAPINNLTSGDNEDAISEGRMRYAVVFLLVRSAGFQVLDRVDAAIAGVDRNRKNLVIVDMVDANSRSFRCASVPPIRANSPCHASDPHISSIA